MSSRPVPATTETHGPFRKVVGTVTRYASTFEVTELHPKGRFIDDPSRPFEVEVLECGHPGSRVGWEPAKKRRCGQCRPAWLAEQEAIAAGYRSAQARRNADDAERVRAEMATREGHLADVEARIRRRAFTVHD